MKTKRKRHDSGKLVGVGNSFMVCRGGLVVKGAGIIWGSLSGGMAMLRVFNDSRHFKLQVGSPWSWVPIPYHLLHLGLLCYVYIHPKFFFIFFIFSSSSSSSSLSSASYWVFLFYQSCDQRMILFLIKQKNLFYFVSRLSRTSLLLTYSSFRCFIQHLVGGTSTSHVPPLETSLGSGLGVVALAKTLT